MNPPTLSALSPLQWIALAAALFILNFALTFHNVWPTLWITTRHELSVEVATVLLLLAVWSSVVRPPAPRFFALLTAALTVLALGRYMEVTAPALYGRAVNIYWDAQHLPAVAAMLADVASPLQLTALLAGLLTLLAVIVGLIAWSLLRVRLALHVTAGRRALMLLSGILVALYWQGHTGSPLRTLGWYSLPVTATYHRQVRFVAEAMNEARGEGRLPPPVPLPEVDLARVAGSDVFIVFIESYGATVFDRESIHDALGDGRTVLGDAIAATGRRVVSAFVEAPTFGGASWLAHISFMTAQEIRDNGSYGLMLTQHRDTLARLFSNAGFRTVALMPGLRSEWPEGAFYGFDRIYGAGALDYRGPAFGWWRVPDQFALARLDQLEVGTTTRQPLFVFFPTISTHMPFRPTPPYQPNWSQILTERPFDEPELSERLAIGPEWTDMAPAYTDSIDYTYRYIGGYLRRRPDPGSVWVLLGDHQPAASVTGPGARWDVPVHVISTNIELLEALVTAGFVPGLAPDDTAIGSMDELAIMLLGAFSSDQSVVRRHHQNLSLPAAP